MHSIFHLAFWRWHISRIILHILQLSDAPVWLSELQIIYTNTMPSTPWAVLQQKQFQWRLLMSVFAPRFLLCCLGTTPTGRFILPSCSSRSVPFATCSSQTPRGRCDFSPKLLKISPRVLRHRSLLRPHEGDCARPWDSDPLHLTAWVCDGTHETNTSS